ncbi:CsbD family protein [Curtobacterium citreum]|uniref:CsbD family protein n=1 Tax=Curtobacterium citreum TaxID=2036 RepID=A0ABU8YEU3_9MICO
MAGIENIKNAAEKAAGKVKEAVGNATDNDHLKAEGKTDQVKADTKQAGTNVKDAASGVADSLKNDRDTK